MHPSEVGQVAPGSDRLPPCAPPTSPERRPQARGKFLYLDGAKLWVRGVTYGTFRPGANGDAHPGPEAVERDLARIAANGLNAIRTYTVPPRWLLDAAERHGLHVMVGLPWEQHVAFLDDGARARAIEEQVRAGVRACAGHPALLCYAIGNEVPAPIVRWHGRRRVERYLERLHRAAKAEDPHGLVSYVSYPSTEYLSLPFLDLLCFNVYLESREGLETYLARLHNLAGDRPLLMGEIGLCSRRNGVDTQARVLDWQVRTVFAVGCAGAFVFAWTDQWHRGGHEIEDWDFGLTSRDRQPKPALAVVRDAFAEVPFPPSRPWPRISVVACSYNGAGTIRDCLEGLLRLDYPSFEVIVVNDGSNDQTAAIARQHGFRVISTEHRGLSSARNTGLLAATGEIIAYIDDDAYPDPHWLTYLAATLTSSTHVGVGGPNVAPPGDGTFADCVAHAPGTAAHVLLSDREAEHIPGCNMAFWKAALEAIGGFDTQFRTAGDDVDVCWRLREQGWTLGFSHGALVFHHRRSSVRAYWRQQVGYGRAEALLERKWPEKYNAVGHPTWTGRLYGSGLPQALCPPGRIYQGTWGSAPFQSLYQPAPGTLSSLPLMPEWYLLIALLAGLSALGTLWTPLLSGVPALGLAILLSLAQAVLSAARAPLSISSGAPRSRLARLARRGLIASIHLLQPAARLRGRLEGGLTPWRRRGWRGPGAPRPRTVVAWSERWRAADERLAALEAVFRAHRAVVLRGGAYDRWDLEMRAGLLGAARARMAVEEHGAGRQLVRLRVWPRSLAGGLGLTLLSATLSAAAGLDGAPTVGALLGGAAIALALRTLWEAGVATTSILQAFAESGQC